MSLYHWSNRDSNSSIDSCDSSESTSYINLYQSAKSSRRNSTDSERRCSNGHELNLVPVIRERNTSCADCSANIRVKPTQILCYHCEECDEDFCGVCVSAEMKDILNEERSKAMTEIEYHDCHGGGFYRGGLTSDEKRVGHGTMQWTAETSSLCGSIYEGYWKNDKREGHGKFTYPDGGVYEGLWKNDEKSGYGRRSFSNGFKYHGSFKNGMKDGKGIFKGVTGRWCFAVWENDLMVGPAKFPPRVRANTSSVLDD